MNEKQQKAVESFGRFLAVLGRLRAPDGCPWDRKQTVETMVPLILEEAFEVADAVEEGQDEKLEEELGDLSMNLLMTALIAEEKGDFNLAEVFERISDKLINRHPHVFGDDETLSEDPFLERWEKIKKDERLKNKEDPSAVAGIPRSLPALLRAVRLLEKMKRSGADLPIFREPDKSLCEGGVSKEEAGEILFGFAISCVQSKINPEMALRAYLMKVENRFRALEESLSEDLGRAGPAEIDRLWFGGGA